jgi:glucan phosphoethanolaminetransferase (alkaline phosphatase superfamily)
MHQSPLTPFTLFHVLLSIVGLVAGLVFLLGLFYGRFLRGWTFTFLGFTIATSVTGFFFPFKGITPGIVLGILSLIVLAIAIVAYRKHWTRTFVITCAAAEFFNVLVFIVQSFQKLSPLHMFAPKGTEPIVAVCQLIALLFFITLATLDIRRHRFILE